MRKVLTASILALLASAWPAARQEVALPNASGSVKFAVIGDNGTGQAPQYEVGRQMAAERARFPFDFVIMVGDNLYGRQEPGDFVEKFERPYASLLETGVRFFAALGNHDKPTSRYYGGFNMQGERYYSFARGPVRFFVFDTNVLDAKQVEWIDQRLTSADEAWKICYFHHPLYSNAGRHGSDPQLRAVLEPILVRTGVRVVFSGHDHIYERIRPQKGITYFVAGSGGQLRKGDLEPSPMTAASFDEDRAFMLVEIAGDVLTFRAVSRTGRVVDAGVIPLHVETTIHGH